MSVRTSVYTSVFVSSDLRLSNCPCLYLNFRLCWWFENRPFSCRDGCRCHNNTHLRTVFYHFYVVFTIILLLEVKLPYEPACPFVSRLIGESFSWLVGRSVGWSVLFSCKGKKFHYLSSCYHYYIIIIHTLLYNHYYYHIYY